ncbi:MAG: hypothetical protein ACYTG0_37890, partial [Planctomycetota bacterium]
GGWWSPRCVPPKVKGKGSTVENSGGRGCVQQERRGAPPAHKGHRGDDATPWLSSTVENSNHRHLVVARN